MAEEDQAKEGLEKALIRVVKIPRPTTRDKILRETMYWCAAHLGLTIIEEIKP